MNEEELKQDLLIADLDAEARLMRARNERLKAENQELLEALKDMVRQFENCPEEQSNCHDGAPEPITQWDFDAFQTLGQARATIAKYGESK